MSIRLTISMPAHNEERSVEQVAREVLRVLDDLEGDGELLVIDDGSTDRTPNILAALAAEDSRIRVIRNDKNLGIEGFNRQMLECARGEWVFFISSDGEFDPTEALRFLELADRDSLDAVLGYREAKQYSVYRSIVSGFFNTCVLIFFSARFKDIGSIRLLRRSVYCPIRLYSSSAFINAERLLVARRYGARIRELPVAHRRRLAGKGRGSRPAKVIAAFYELCLTRWRWFFFGHYYGRSRGAG